MPRPKPSCEGLNSPLAPRGIRDGPGVLDLLDAALGILLSDRGAGGPGGPGFDIGSYEVTSWPWHSHLRPTSCCSFPRSICLAMCRGCKACTVLHTHATACACDISACMAPVQFYKAFVHRAGPPARWKRLRATAAAGHAVHATCSAKEWACQILTVPCAKALAPVPARC